MSGENEKNSTELIKEAEAQLRLALDHVGDGSWDWNISSGEVFYSDRWIESLRYIRRAVHPNIHFWRSLIHPDDYELFRKALSKHFERRTEHFEVEYRLLMGTAEYRWTLDRGRVLERDENGDALRIAGTSFDITRQKLTEQQHEQDELHFRAIVDTAGCVILALNPNFRILEWNRAAEEIYGWRRSEVWGKNYIEEFLSESVRGPVSDEIRKILAGADTKNFENPVVARDGKERILLWNATRLLDTHGEVLGIVAIGQDITEWKRAEQERESALQNK
jgi:PAS domain S-box-containing protein